MTHLSKHISKTLQNQCNVYADASFSDLMVEFRRIASVCSNVGVAIMVRVNPELADHEHLYYEQLHEKGDENFNAVYDRARKRYFSLLRGASVSLELAGQIPIAEPASPGEPGGDAISGHIKRNGTLPELPVRSHFGGAHIYSVITSSAWQSSEPSCRRHE